MQNILRVVLRIVNGELTCASSWKNNIARVKFGTTALQNASQNWIFPTCEVKSRKKRSWKKKEPLSDSSCALENDRLYRSSISMSSNTRYIECLEIRRFWMLCSLCFLLYFFSFVSSFFLLLLLFFFQSTACPKLVKTDEVIGGPLQ